MPVPQSPLAAAVAKVGDRWTLLLVEALLDGPRRFGQLRETVTGIAPNILSQRLKHLEREGVIAARAYSERPTRFTYALTDSGAELASALSLLAAWGAAHSSDAQAPAHVLCGTPLQVRWYCPTCDLPVPDADADELRYA